MANAEITVGSKMIVNITDAYDIKDILKGRGYDYVGPDKKWTICFGIVRQDDAAAEYKWLRSQAIAVTSPQSGMIDRLDKMFG